jgi:predicted nucleic acid-binding protein
MSMKLVDTSAWVEFLRRKGDPSVKQKVARLLEAELAAHTCPIRFELLSGVRTGDEEADLDRALSFSRHIPFEAEDWRAAARLERELRSQGVTVPRNDLFVITVAVRARLEVSCRDAHFSSAARALGGRLRVEEV